MKRLDRKAAEIAASLQTAKIFKKQGTVTARLGVVGEKVETVLGNQQYETKNEVKEEGSMVVTNPGGEQYVVKGATFAARYEESTTPGTYHAKGYIRAINNPAGEPIVMLASWGEDQNGGADCMIADVCDAEGNNLKGEPYIIDAQAFATTYKEVEPVTA